MQNFDRPLTIVNGLSFGGESTGLAQAACGLRIGARRIAHYALVSARADDAKEMP
jgi:hypothetical protein